jgi:hypothetical protein
MEARMNNMAHGIAAGILIGTGVFTVAADRAAVTPPQPSVLLLELFADGVQIYVCEAKETRFQWSFKGPEANLFDKQGRQIGTHFGGPTWKLGDGSAVVGEVIEKADAPEPDAIQWLLLRAKSHEGSGTLSAVAYIRRTETKGGAAPRVGCDASHLSEEARIRYSATYQFFSAGET